MKFSFLIQNFLQDGLNFGSQTRPLPSLSIPGQKGPMKLQCFLGLALSLSCVAQVEGENATQHETHHVRHDARHATASQLKFPCILASHRTNFLHGLPSCQVGHTDNRTSTFYMTLITLKKKKNHVNGKILLYIECTCSWHMIQV